MALTPEQNLKAEQAFAQSDEGGKGYLHSKEFFYACQALGFNYSFVECFEMYKIYDDNNSLRMNIEEFKRFYAAKLKDPASHVDPNRVTNVYTNTNRTVTNVGYIPNNVQPGVYKESTTTVTQSGPIGQTVVTNGGQTTTTYQTGTVVQGGQTYVTTTNQPTYVTSGQQVLTTGGQQIVTTTGGKQVLTTTGGQLLTSGGQIVTAADGTRRVIGGNIVTTGSHIVGQRLGTYTTGGSHLVVTGNEMSRYDTENKGWITKEQLRVACKDLAVKCDTDEELDAIWNEIDLNKTGRVNSYEFGEFYDYVKGFRDLVRQKRA